MVAIACPRVQAPWIIPGISTMAYTLAASRPMRVPMCRVLWITAVPVDNRRESAPPARVAPTVHHARTKRRTRAHQPADTRAPTAGHALTNRRTRAHQPADTGARTG